MILFTCNVLTRMMDKRMDIEKKRIAGHPWPEWVRTAKVVTRAVVYYILLRTPRATQKTL